ncbi:MAG: hypothetical protein D3924_18905 [Candidatus Electrothrix sp. AR4]|nr:hypothetical protein [Candidatus Electrothrix sp. AR4]
MGCVSVFLFTLSKRDDRFSTTVFQLQPGIVFMAALLTFFVTTLSQIVPGEYKKTSDSKQTTRNPI